MSVLLVHVSDNTQRRNNFSTCLCLGMALRVLWLLAAALLHTAAAQSAAHARFHARVPAALRQSLAHAVQVGTGATASAAAAGLRRHRAAQDAAQPGAAAAGATQAPPGGGGGGPAIVGAALRVTPAQFGGDPTGATDSTAGVLAAVATCINASIASTNGAFSFGSHDARGCTVDLEGGEYLISKPIVIPTGVSNMRVQTGSLVANPASDAWGSAAAATAAATAAAAITEDEEVAGAAAAARLRSLRDACEGGGKAFPYNRSGWWCQGLRPAPAGAATTDNATACEQACCDDGACQVWQLCARGAACAAAIPSGQTCWLGSSIACSDSDPTAQAAGWLGGSTDAPPAPTPPPPTPAPGPMTDVFMVQVGGLQRDCHNPQGSCNENLGFPGLFLDGSRVANGFLITAVMGTTVGPQTYVLNFTQYGVKIDGGHEVMIDETWFGETNFDHHFSAPAPPPKATAISIGSNDHYVTNSIVFSARVGIEVAGAANFIAGLHVWFPWNKAARIEGVSAFYDHGSLNRYHGCYIDGSTALFENANELQWLGGFILGGVGLRFTGTKGLELVQVKDNIFSGGGIFLSPDVPGAPLPALDVLIENNQFNRVGANKASRATKAVAHATSPTAVWAFDFCSELLFPNITRVRQLTIEATSGFPVAVARPPQGCQLVVETSEPMTGRITVQVDSSEYSDPCRLC